MDAATIDRIVGLVREADAIERAPDFNVTGRYYTRDGDGTLHLASATQRPPCAQLLSTADLAAQIHADLESSEGTAAVYVAPDRMRALIISSDDVRWTHDFDLPRHPAYLAVERLLETRAMTQRELVRFLRATLNGHVEEATVEQFRLLRVVTDGESETAMAKGREAIDRRLAQQVLIGNVNAPPDSILVSIPVYDVEEAVEAGGLHDVEILVEATTDANGKPIFELTTVLNSLRSAANAALDDLRVSLGHALKELGLVGSAPVYNGRVND